MKKLYHYSLIFLTLVLLGTLLYYQSFHFGFFLDDDFQIVNNPLVHDLSNWYLHFTKSTVALDNGQSGGIYFKPVMMIAYSMLWQLTPEQPVAFRVFQLLIHCLNASLIFVLFRNFFRKDFFLLPVAAALVFLVHPINSEAVLFIADLQEPLYTAFGLLALLVLTRATDRWQYVLPTALLLLLSLLSKESGLLFVLISAIYCLLFQKPYQRKFIVSLVAVGGIYFFFRLGLAQLTTIHSDTMQISRASVLTRFLTMPQVLVHYIHLFFWPEHISLTQDWVVAKADFKQFWLPLLQIVAFLSLCVYFLVRTKDKVFLFFLLWFGLGWGLHSQLVPLDGTVSDRWFYFTIIGFLGMLCCWLNKLEIKARYIIFPLVLVSAAFAVRTHARIQNWKSPMDLYLHDLQIDPNSFYLNNNLGLELFKLKRFEESIPYFEKSISASVEKSTAWFTAVTNLGSAYLFMGLPGKAESFLKIALEGQDIKSHRAYAAALLELGLKPQLDAFLIVALAKFPNDTVLLKLKDVPSAQ